MPWTEIFLVLVVSHLTGDFLLQTEWQALNKYGGLGGSGDPLALLSHIGSYTLAFAPALIWLSGDVGAWALGLAALIALPHLVQDDGRLLQRYIQSAKHADTRPGDMLFTAVDQCFHVLALFGVALLATV